ncbi:hypothetical protein M426DRAFT_323063 [Hypoxylon sp. CI-4A]|nr:hypothetical protein M426DRAFT_323063 [Hypoxylon sp. CI-4A]
MPPGIRPKEVHTKHLTERERFRVRTLYYDAQMNKKRIEEVTGYSRSQIRTAIRAKDAAIPPRSGRPKKGTSRTQAGGNPSGEQPVSEDKYSTTPSSSSLVATPQPGAFQQQQHQRRTPPSFASLPIALRRHIWQLFLTTYTPTPTPSSSSSSYYTPQSPQPLSCTWWLQKLPQPPWLQTGAYPQPHPQPHHQNPQLQLQPHQNPYEEHRHPAAKILCAVNREARQVVLDTLAPVCAADAGAGHRMFGSTVRFLWIDPRCDRIYCRDGFDDLSAWLDRAKGAVLPWLSVGGGGAGAVRNDDDGNASREEDGGRYPLPFRR